MNTITVKIVSWEENGQSLVCKFASDETLSSNPDDYNGLAFQPKLMWPEATTSEDILENIARAGISICEQLKKEEELSVDASQLSIYSGLVNTHKTFNVADIVIDNNVVIEVVAP